MYFQWDVLYPPDAPSETLSSTNMDGMVIFADHADGLVQDCGISIAKAMEIPQCCIKPSLWYLQDYYHNESWTKKIKETRIPDAVMGAVALNTDKARAERWLVGTSSLQ